jgi:SWI/SNF related-matrix-associated actin-dependent regulator of chromatin subfamily C
MRWRAGAPQPTGVGAVLRLKPRPSPAEGVEAAAGGGGARVRPGAFRRAAPQPPAAATGARFFCNAMPWVDCTALRYHCTRIPDVDLCPQAYAEGRFPPGCAAKDFVRVTAADAVPDPSGWSPQETLLLLEAQELFGDDWAAVAEHVGGRSQLQCILHMLHLPLEEYLLPPGGAAAAGGGGGEGEDDLPFADSPNPVMSLLGFLSSFLGSRVAAAASQRALEFLAEHDAGGGQLDEACHRAAARAALAAAATQAQVLADEEEREMMRLALAACEGQLRRVQAKFKFLESIDGVVRAQAVSLPGVRQTFVEELAVLRGAGPGAAAPAEGAAGAPEGAGPPGGAQPAADAPAAAPAAVLGGVVPAAVPPVAPQAAAPQAAPPQAQQAAP